MVINYNGMYYILGRPDNIRSCWKYHALGLLLFTNDFELI